MIRQKQQSRAQQMDSFIDNLAARYGGSSNKAKGTKRKAAPKAESTSKTKIRK